MDAGDLYKASSSLRATSKRSSSFRANSSSIWRNTGIEVFSRSSREEDDEEALKWAALEKLPTFDRLRKGLLLGSKGANEVDVQNLGFQDKRNLVERLINTVEEDNEKFLLKLRNRIDRVGIDLPTIEVRYEHLNIDAEAYSASRALPTFVNFNINIIEGFLNSLHILSSRKKPFTILKDVSGIIKPCRMTLLLGPPSSGKTTLLLALAGKLDPTLKTSGRVTYNGHGMEEFVPQRTAAYISQHDLHIGEMTVRETLAFSARCQGVGSRYEMLAELSRREKAANIKPDPDIDIYMKAAATEGDEANVVTDYVLKVLGLDVCADTLVGDEMIRGISGGQRKRVTTGEMLVGPAKALFMDEISTGLDSSTTYQIVNMLRQYVHIMKGTAFISLLQPAPETYDLFDDIVLLSDGQIVYQGPRENVLDFFESMGFKCPERKGVADFLQEVTSKKDQRQYWARRNEPYRFISVSEFAEAFQSYVVGRRVGDELAVPFDKSKSHPAALTTQKYGLGKKELLKACTEREILLMKRNSFVFFFKIFQLTVMSLIVNPRVTIFHYSLDIKQVISRGKRPVKKSKNKSDLRLIRDKLFLDDSARFPLNRTAYDGEKNLYSAVSLPTGQFRVELSDNDDLLTRRYVVSIELMNELKLSKLEDYLSGKVPHVPRDILQGMDLVMKENPSRYRISVDRNFYTSSFKVEDDLKHGIAAYKGFQSTLRPTSQGLTLCLDCSVLAFRKPLAVTEFLKEHITEFDGVYLDLNLRRRVTNALKGLTVRVTHRVTKQLYTITGLTAKGTCDLWFDFVDPKGKDPTVKVSLVQYFREKYGKDIVNQGIPCLILGRNNRTNHVPMEFCILAEGQRFRKELLDEVALEKLDEKCLAWPPERRKTISEMMQAHDGPCGDATKNFGLQIDKNMTSVEGRVIGPPDLKLGAPDGTVDIVRVENEKCQWNLAENSVVEGKRIERWALIEFSSSNCLKLRAKDFIKNLRNRSRNLGICMEEPLLCHFTGMREFSSVSRLEELLRSVVQETCRKSWNKLQIIICVMAEKHHGYKYLKWVSETRIGVVTQCCLSMHANRGDDQFLGNLCLKINAKLGGSNVELTQRLPHFKEEDHVMFIGADVNHPVSKKSTTPSIAAVVSTVNWPAVNRYAARVCPQDHRTEKIVEFGSMCRDLINTYFQLNKVKPKKIVVFRDGVSEGQFDMVLNEELSDLRSAICDDNYQPTITLVVAQKRHQTRLFLENVGDGGATGNVPPGTVVDTKIVHPFEFDFYLCSHYGRIGTSKAVRYCVLWDENSFTSDQLQKLIYNLCFTFARSTRPVSLVPPVYYADLVAYRGRIFQEVAKEFQSHSVPSSVGTSLSPSNSTTLDQSFYNLHPDLQNIMFFV